MASKDASRGESASSSSDQDRIGALLSRALDGPEEGWAEEVARVCAEHPDQAEGIRRRFARLRHLGLDRAPRMSVGARKERVGEFRLLEELGSGGMGVVHLAEQESLGRRVALKLIRGGALHEPRARARFRREVEAASRLDHPGICTVYEAGEVDGTPYIAMRYVEGESLAQRIARARESAARGDDSTASGSTPRKEVEATLALFETAARALHAAHEAGLVHRDVKPGNIMVTPGGDPVILDFGLARIEDSDAGTLTGSSSSLGTPAYMSPEQVSGSAHSVDRRTDVYSLGVALYEALTLRRPFEAPTREGLYRRVLRGDPPDPRRHNRRLSRELKVVLDTALERDPTHRYQTALHLAEDLRRIRAHEPIRARPAGPGLRLRRWVQRNPVGAALIGVLAVGLAVTLVLLQQVAHERDEKERTLIRARALALSNASASELEEDPMLALLLAREAFRLRPGHETRSGLLAALASSHERQRFEHPALLASAFYSPDGERILTAAGKIAYLWSADGELLRELGPHRSQLMGARFSVDGSRILTLTRHGAPRLWDGEGRSLGRLWSPAGVEWGVYGLIASKAAAFSPDGSRVLVGDRAGSVWLFDCDGALLWAPGRVHAGEVLCVAFAPDGELMASGSRDGLLVVWDADGAVRHRLELGLEVSSVSFSPDGRTLLSACADGVARVWDLANGSLRARLEGHVGTVHSAAFSPDGRLVATAGQDQTLRLWQWGLEDVEPRILEFKAAVTGARFSGDGRFLVSFDNGGMARVHDREGRLVAELRGHRDRLGSAVFSPAAGRVLTASHDGTARVWDVSIPEFPTLQGPGGVIGTGVFSPDGGFALGSREGRGGVFDDSGELLAELAAEVRFTGLSWSARGDRLVSSHDDGTLMLWDAGGASLGRFRATADGLAAVAFSPDGSRILAGGKKTVGLTLWALGEAGLEREVEFDPGEYVYAVAFSPDGARVLAGGVNDVFLWPVEGGPGERLRLTDVSGDASRGASFSPDGRGALVGLATGDVALLDVSGGRFEEVRRLSGGHGAVKDAAFSPSGDLVCAGFLDGTVRLWSLEGGHLATLRHGRDEIVWSVAFSPDGRRVLSTSSGGTARFWPVLSDAELLALADARATRGFRAEELAEYAELLPARAAAPVPPVTSDELNLASWEVARGPGHSAEAYARALRLAERANEVRPGVAALLNTLGAARYRAGRYRDAIAALSSAEGLNRRAERADLRAYDLVFLAMSHARLGETDTARALLEELRTLAPDEADAELGALLEEARGLAAGEGSPRRAARDEVTSKGRALEGRDGLPRPRSRLRRTVLRWPTPGTEGPVTHDRGGRLPDGAGGHLGRRGSGRCAPAARDGRARGGLGGRCRPSLRAAPGAGGSDPSPLRAAAGVGSGPPGRASWRAADRRLPPARAPRQRWHGRRASRRAGVAGAASGAEADPRGGAR